MTLTKMFPVVEMGDGPTPPEIVPHDWELLLADGREVKLTRLEQHQTYGGVLCGIPYDPEADATRALSEASEWDQGFHQRPAVVPATIVRGTRTVRPSHLPPGTSVEPRPWAYLPVVTSFGVFESRPREGSYDDRSSVLVIWWQGHFGIPADLGVLAALSRLNWDSHAEGWSM